MSVIFLLIPLSVVIATGFLLAFVWAVRSGQYEDTCTPSMRMLLHDGVRPAPWKEETRAGLTAAPNASSTPDKRVASLSSKSNP